MHAAVSGTTQCRGDGVHALFEHGTRHCVACRLRGDVEAGHNLVKLLRIYVRHQTEGLRAASLRGAGGVKYERDYAKMVKCERDYAKMVKCERMPRRGRVPARR